MLNSLLVTVSVVYILILTAYYIATVHYARRHSVSTAKKPKRWPDVDIVVPCYNEQPAILEACLKSLVNLDYPGKLHVYIIDDGSTNRVAVKSIYHSFKQRDNWQVFELAHNEGKRMAQNLALRKSRGELVALVDSDTQIAADGLRLMVSALLGDEKIGAVASNLRISNAHDNLLTWLVDIRYGLARDLTFAAESAADSVSICPGPFAVYRRKALDDIWERYITQTFRGVRCTNGDDAHLTNLVLAAGYLSRYVAEARAWTNTSANLTDFFKQQLRWARSHYREVFWTLDFVHRRSWYLWLRLINFTLLPPLLGVILILMAASILTRQFNTTALMVLSSISLVGFLIGTQGTRKPHWALLYGVLHIAKSANRLYALATMGRSSWITRKSTVTTPAHKLETSET